MGLKCESGKSQFSVLILRDCVLPISLFGCPLAWTDPLAKEDRADGSKRRIRIKARSQKLVIPIVVTENIVC
jgi:hypothetical protein